MKEQFFEFLESLHGDEALMEAVRKGFETIVEMGGTNRLYNKLTASTPSYAILTAFRGAYSKSQNLKRNQQLATDLRKMGYNWTKVSGGWIEDEDVNYENSYMVENPASNNEQKFLDDMGILINKYDQDAFTYKASNSNDVMFVDKSGTAHGTDDGTYLSSKSPHETKAGDPGFTSTPMGKNKFTY